ncbi:Cro/CI family transcriptional regulator [Acinetobacter sp. ANC 5579]|uniref:Cro/CI family transcriptional regulator n=1 Tax=Acinetobacter amyesii TaxID=2942470 RepID=UPI0020BE1442|nr:Cro/CI family transcriptional regulator [Acinetobacter amyesii]MCL6234053.1 Cro/CI family transcriptional regulator [Acinetobacter amyesii]
MTKQEALKLLKCNVADLALKLEISSQAISQWPETKIPLMREYQIRDLAKGQIPIKRSSTKNSNNPALQ